MDDTKIYMQPLGLLRGCFHSCENLKKIAGTDLCFSHLKIIIRDDVNYASKIISLSKLNEYLEKQPKIIQNKIVKTLNNIEEPRQKLTLKNDMTLNWNKQIIQGVLNVTPDSFSDGGFHNQVDDAVSLAKQMIGAGVVIIDIGGETTKPGALPVSIDLEKGRVLPVLKKISGMGIPISIDTRNAEVMSAAIDAGATIINDVSALEHDNNSISVVSESGLPVILMHSQGTPETMQDNPEYQDVVLDIYDYLRSKIEVCLEAGIPKKNIIIDPGLGFGKTVDHNLLILQNISIFHGLGVPILIGASRKSFIGKITGQETASDRTYGSVAVALHCLGQGVQIVRVHDVKETVDAISMWNAVNCENDIL